MNGCESEWRGHACDRVAGHDGDHLCLLRADFDRPELTDDFTGAWCQCLGPNLFGMDHLTVCGRLHPDVTQ